MSPRTSIDPKFEINSYLKSEIFSPDYNKVTGTLTLDFSRETKSIISFELGFMGNVCSYYKLVTGSGKTKLTRYLSEKDNLFLATTVLFDSRAAKGRQTTEYVKGDQEVFPINFEFPSDRPLPSSYDGQPVIIMDNTGSFSVEYILFLRVNYLSSFRQKESFVEYKIPVKYQGAPSFNFVEKVGPIMIDSKVFKSKLKMFLPEKESGLLIENHVQDSHRHTRFIRKLWNDDYKKENISKFSQDIELNIFLSIPESFNLALPLNSVPLTIETPSVIKYDPDFSFEGSSTKLGYFEIESISLKLENSFSINCKNCYYNDVTESDLWTYAFPKDRRPSFDIKEFVENKERETFALTTILSGLIETPTPLIELMKKPVLCDFQHTLFSNFNSLIILLTVGDGQPNDHHHKTFKFKGGVNIFSEHPALPDNPPLYSSIVGSKAYEEEEASNA